MRYYNENPQVTLWREECKRLKAENEELKDEIAQLTLDINQFAKRIETMNEDKEREEEVLQERGKRFVSLFNSLPWYKKMFYKFKV